MTNQRHNFISALDAMDDPAYDAFPERTHDSHHKAEVLIAIGAAGTLGAVAANKYKLHVEQRHEITKTLEIFRDTHNINTTLAVNTMAAFVVDSGPVSHLGTKQFIDTHEVRSERAALKRGLRNLRTGGWVVSLMVEGTPAFDAAEELQSLAMQPSELIAVPLLKAALEHQQITQSAGNLITR